MLCTSGAAISGRPRAPAHLNVNTARARARVLQHHSDRGDLVVVQLCTLSAETRRSGNSRGYFKESFYFRNVTFLYIGYLSRAEICDSVVSLALQIGRFALNR